MWITVGLFGALGSMLRFGIDRLALSQNLHAAWGTFVINMVGCALMGLLWQIFQYRADISESMKLGLLVGLCGGFTTFSSFSLQGIQLIQSGQLNASLLYLLASPFIGLFFCYLGIQTGRWMGT